MTLNQTGDLSDGADRIVITGAGLVTCLGLDRKTTWEAVRLGRSGLAPLTAIESPLSPNKGGGQAPDIPEATKDGSRRETAYLRKALRDALGEAGIGAELPYPPGRCGLLLGTTLHGMRNAGRFLRTRDLEWLRWFNGGSVLEQVIEGLPLSGPVVTSCSACSSGLASVALACSLLAAGDLDLVLAGGYDPVSEYAYAGFNCMRLVTEGRVRPFARGRDGMKLGEGYGVLVLERMGDASARGASTVATIAGYGESCDAHHLSKPHPQGAGAVAAMSAALESAGLSASQISLIAAHATATPDNDAAEFAAMSHVFGDDLRSIPVVAFKSHLGHTLGGAGAVELILSAMALRDQVVPPCAREPSDEVEFEILKLTGGDPVKKELRHTLNTSLGFGGANTCVILSAASTSSETHDPGRPAATSTHRKRSKVEREVMISGVGVVLPGVTNQDQFVSLFGSAERPPVDEDTGGVDAAELEGLLSARRVRRMSDYVKLTLAATTLALQDAGAEPTEEFGESCCAILGTTHGSVAYSQRYYQQIVDEGVDAANPLLFAEGVPNAAAAHLSTMLSIKGFCQTIIGTRTAGLDALRLAALRIRSGEWDRAIVSAADEYVEVVNQAYGHHGLYHGGAPVSSKRWRGFATGCGAVTLVLESSNMAARRDAVPRGVLGPASGAFCSPLATRQGVKAVGRVISQLGDPDCFITSANDTWLDRVEYAALRRPRRHGSGGDSSRERVVSRVYGTIAEAFSAGPLVALAAVLLTGRMPRWRGANGGILDRPNPGFQVSSGDQRPDAVGILGLDYCGMVSGVRVAVNSDRIPLD